MQTLTQLEMNVIRQPNSVELKQALAERYFEQGSWEDAAKTYRSLSSLHMSTAALFINRIRLGAVALMISSALIFAVGLTQPVLSTRNPVDFAEAISSPAYLSAQLMFVLALALYSCSAISIYKLLSYTRDHRPAFWAMVLSVIGAGLSMPVLGINLIVLPVLGKMILEGQTDILTIYFSINEYPSNVFLGIGGYLIILGIVIFGWVIWRTRGLSVPSVWLFLAGWIGIIVAGIPSNRFFLISFGALIALGGMGLGLSLWNQASGQFEAGMDRSMT